MCSEAEKITTATCPLDETEHFLSARLVNMRERTQFFSLLRLAHFYFCVNSVEEKLYKVATLGETIEAALVSILVILTISHVQIVEYLTYQGLDSVFIRSFKDPTGR
jgi:hypothetical protein